MDAPASAGDAESNAEADEDVEDELDDEEDEQDEASVASPAGPVELDLPEEEDVRLDWYILKVQSNRERSIADALRRKIAIEGLDHLFGQVLVPTEKVTEFKGGKKKIVERKLWPGYIAVEMHVNDDTWFAIRETSGIGDFTGSAGKPTPMEPSEVAMILQSDVEETEEAPKLDIKFSPGDKVKVMEGNFENFEGEVSSIDETHGRVTVMLSIFGRPTPVELEYWQVEGL
nr:transcription termination/antitermination protein NusG [Aeoliella straminimaris]